MIALQERIALFQTPRDWFRYAVSQFRAAGLVFGHGTDCAEDEAAFLVLEALHLPIETLDPFADAKLTRDERERVDGLIDQRITTRKPAAYLLNRAYIQGVPFYVDERVIVPRSFLGELLFSDCIGEGGLIETPHKVRRILDLCTGGGSLAILAARIFPQAYIDAVDISADALAVAQRNVAEHKLEKRIRLITSDLFSGLKGEVYDLILTNPPYVRAEAVEAFPPEYAAEPRLAHLGGEDGLDIVRKIVSQARTYLSPQGALMCEIGQEREAFLATFPALDVLWLDTRASEGEVFFAHATTLGLLQEC